MDVFHLISLTATAQRNRFFSALERFFLRSTRIVRPDHTFGQKYVEKMLDSMDSYPYVAVISTRGEFPQFCIASSSKPMSRVPFLSQRIFPLRNAPVNRSAKFGILRKHVRYIISAHRTCESNDVLHNDFCDVDWNTFRTPSTLRLQKVEPEWEKIKTNN